MHTRDHATPAMLRALEPFLAALGAHAQPSQFGAEVLRLRAERHFGPLFGALDRLYGSHVEALLPELGARLAAAAAVRPEPLMILDLEREMTPDWFQRQTQVGGIYYADLFAGSLQGVRERLPYIRELGLTYVHLMPLLEPRSGPNDGGYAVANYRAVDPRLGTLDDLRALSADLHAAGISLCVDVVVNHTAAEHPWAEAARAGERRYQDFYLLYPDRTLPDAYEQTLPEVFPDFAPGNFTWSDELAAWVWTTFNDFQWDLNYSNPHVWIEMLDILLFLANCGVDVLRLDAVPFMWKRLGTDCQNQPEVLDILQAWRAAVRMVAPATIFKAEAIVPPQQLVQYLGEGQRSGLLCDLAYHNVLMVLLWSSLATKSAALFHQALGQMPAPPQSSAWITYVRCHDDIGWAITDADAQAIGETGPGHRGFLSDWYSGAYPGTWARGAVFQHNPRTGDRRISGMTASLAGLEAALAAADPHAVTAAIKRITLLYSLIISFGGIPLIYMGDELGLLNDWRYAENPAKALDNRWLHRPSMPWEVAALRQDPATIPGRIWEELRHLITVRKRTAALHSSAPTYPFWTNNSHVLGFVRVHAIGPVLVLANLHDTPQHVALELCAHAGISGGPVDLLAPPQRPLALSEGLLELGPYQTLWLTSVTVAEGVL